jgi:hypothetical protein
MEAVVTTQEVLKKAFEARRGFAMTDKVAQAIVGLERGLPLTDGQLASATMRLHRKRASVGMISEAVGLPVSQLNAILGAASPKAKPVAHIVKRRAV